VLKTIGGSWIAFCALGVFVFWLEGQSVTFPAVASLPGLLPFILLRQRKEEHNASKPLAINKTVNAPAEKTTETNEQQKATPLPSITISENTSKVIKHIQREKATYDELDVERYEILGAGDAQVCSKCATMDGKVFNIEEWETGKTTPPFCDDCRCTTIPYFED